MRRKCMRVLAMLLAILSIAMVFPSTSEAATVPSIDLEASCKNMKVISGSTVYLDFLIERNYQDEYYYVNIYKGNSTAYEDFIGYGDGWVEDYGDTVLLELWFNSADWGLSAGTVCTVEYYLEYWNGSSWVMTKPKTSTFQVIKNSCGSNHSYGSPTFVIDAPTCTSSGYGAYKCTKCGIRKKTDIPKIGHKYGGWVVTRPATCAKEGVRTSACQNCGNTKTESIAKLAHKYDSGKITQQPTCTKEGVKTYTCTGGCGSKKTSAVAKIPHKYDEGVVRTAPTCTLDGLKIYTCLGCKGTKSEVIPKGHTWNEGNIIIAPTVAKEGLKDCVCVDCGEPGKVEIPAIFSDVHTDWYTEYVQYVYDEGIMSGISGTTKFQPNDNITKAQVAQVLYNMEGKPNPGGDYIFNDLKDVYSVEWYADAVSWAYNKGIITGDINTMKFNPNAAVTREQLAIMLYRYASSKRYDVSAKTDFAGLIHAENISNWAYDGVNWAVGAGLISGIDKNGVKDLAPQGNASRAQVAAILQRFCENVVSAPEVEPEETPEVTPEAPGNNNGGEALAQYIVANGTTTSGSNGSYKAIKTKVTTNGLVFDATITYRNDLGLLIFHWAYGDSYFVTFDYDIEKGAAGSKILYTDLSKFVVTAETTGVFDIANYVFDSELDFNTVTNIGTSLTDAQIEEDANYYTKLAVLSWGYLMAEQPEMSMKEIGFDSFEASLPTNDAAVKSSMEDVMMAIAQ